MEKNDKYKVAKNNILNKTITIHILFLRLVMKLLLFLILIYSSSSMALNQQACSRLLNDGLYKKYEYGGVDQPLTKAVKRHGSSKGSSATSTEGTTALLDPKYWSNVSTSETQATSSTGECNLFGLNRLKEQRDLYFAQNSDEIMAEIAQGRGEHVSVLASYTLCDQDKFETFGRALQMKMKDFISEEQDYGAIINQAISANSLEKNCYIF